MHHNIVPAMFHNIALQNLALLHLQEFLFSLASYTVPESIKEEPKKPVNRKGGARDLSWQTAEDEILVMCVESYGAKNWSKIAKKINAEVYYGNCFRKGKHCRERWFNHLNPDLNKKDWKPDEDELLNELQQKYGNAWSRIAKKIAGRTENSVRNRWNSLNRSSKKMCMKNSIISNKSHK